jgi:hypothetical protein
MNKRFLLIGVVAIVIAVAGINVKLNYSTNSGGLGGLLLRNIEALSNECGCDYTLTPLPCYKSNEVTYHASESLRDLCPESGDMCPGTTKRGCINGSAYVCHYKKYKK